MAARLGVAREVAGVGLVVVVAAADAEVAVAELKAQGEAVYRIGKIRARQGDEAQTVVV